VSKFGILFFKLVFIFFLGAGVLLTPLYIIDFFIGSELIKVLLGKKAIFDNQAGISLLDVAGIISVALAIWDGQFVDDVKPSHWSRRNTSK
jgi:hypothetical protein